MKNFSLSLYAFHLCNYLSNASDEVVSNADRLWENLAKLSESLLSLPGLKDLKSNLISYQNGIYTPKREQRRVNEWLTNSGKSLPLGIIPTEEGFQMEGNLQPFRLNETYAVDLTLSPELPDTSIDVAQLKYFNPQGCLLPASIDASLGQTLLLCGKVDKNYEECRILAKECAIALLAGSKFCHLCFNNIPIKFWLFVLKRNPVIGILFVSELNLAAAHQGKLFGSLLFEYEVTDLDNPRNPTKQCHILVWLNNSNADTAKLAGEAYDWLRNLLCCRHKIRYAYHDSRLYYKKARKYYSELEKEGQNLAQLPEDLEKRLANLKYSLTQVSTKLFDYEFHLRELQAYLTAIKTNATNYKQCLNQLPTLPEDDLGFWQDFLKKDCNHFQAQIQTDLKYLNPGRDLFQQLITTIRGIVEIEQAESDRALEKTLREKEEAAERREKKLEESRRKEEEAAEEREKRLQLWIALVGTGLAVSSISSQTDAKPVETFLIGRLEPNQTLDCPDAGMSICLEYYGFYIVIHILVGAIAASVLGLIIWLLSNNRLGGKVKQIWQSLTSKTTK